MTQGDVVREAVRVASVRTREQAEAAYSDRFGGFPSFLFMGADDRHVVREVRRALTLGREITPPDPTARY